MATSPEQVRVGLTVVTAAASGELSAAVAAVPAPQARGLLFTATPLIVADYGQASAALGLDWYDELREESPATTPFSPVAVTPLREDYLAGAVAWATESLQDVETDYQIALDESVARLMPIVEREVAAALRETVTENSISDPDAAGWRRFARSGACKFCLMVAARGAIYTERTADFAAHRNCTCLAGPAFDGGTPASVQQYVASQKTRTSEQQAQLREYLNQHFPHAPG